jgi:hypothetical protein
MARSKGPICHRVFREDMKRFGALVAGSCVIGAGAFAASGD